MPGRVIGQGMQPVLGYNYGAGRYHLALRSITLAVIAAILINILAFLLLYHFTDPIIGVFTSDIILIDESTHVARLIFLSMPLVGFFAVGSQAFLAIGKAVQSFIVAVARPALFLLPLVLILPRFLELDGVWLAFPASDVLSFLLLSVMLIPLLRQFKKAAAALPAEA
jgi:Na+-driven multidrug efflux pump